MSSLVLILEICLPAHFHPHLHVQESTTEQWPKEKKNPLFCPSTHQHLEADRNVLDKQGSNSEVLLFAFDFTTEYISVQLQFRRKYYTFFTLLHSPDSYKICLINNQNKMEYMS